MAFLSLIKSSHTTMCFIELMSCMTYNTKIHHFTCTASITPSIASGQMPGIHCDQCASIKLNFQHIWCMSRILTQKSTTRIHCFASHGFAHVKSIEKKILISHYKPCIFLKYIKSGNTQTILIKMN